MVHISGVDVIRNAIKISSIQLHSNDTDDVMTSYGVVTTGKYSITKAAADAFSIMSDRKGFAGSFAFEISKHRCYERELDGLAD